jgi:uncharacterized protein YabN with tetrapyrrole methylase and pyrophosphatase domain
MTIESRSAIEAADEVLYVTADRAMAAWLTRLNPNARSLEGLYQAGRERRAIYSGMVEEILAPVRGGSDVCAAFYGHPGVFVSPSHEAVRIAREEGYPARMLPGISAEDCLFADLGINPGERGCQSYEATELLVRRHRIDATASLIVWQIDLIGRSDYTPAQDLSRLPVLGEYLLEFYPPEHEAVLYAASPYAVADPVLVPVALARLADPEFVPMSTLYVPPLPPPPADPAMLARLGIAPATTP